MISRKQNRELYEKLEISTKALYISIYGKKKFGRYQFVKKLIPNFEHEVLVVGRIKSIKIEIRNTEKGHNLAHFHVYAPGKIDAVYTIQPIAYYEGKIDGKANKAVLEWAEINHQLLINMWNDLHGHRIKVS